MRTILVATLLLLFPMSFPPAAAQSTPETSVNPPSASAAAHASFAEDYLILIPKLKKEEISLSLNEAAKKGYRFAGAALSGRMFTVMSRPKGWSGGARYEYFIVTTLRGSTLDKELTAAYQDGWRLRDLIPKYGVNMQPNLAVLEKEIGKPASAEEIRLVHAQRPSTLEEGLQQAGSEGFRFADVSDNSFNLSAVMTRPAGVKPEARFSYCLTRHPEEVAAEGYRPVKTFHAVIAGEAILERDAQTAPETVSLKLIAPWRISTLVRQLQEAESGGYRWVAMGSLWSTLWVKYPDSPEGGYSYFVIKMEPGSPGEDLEAHSFVTPDSEGKWVPVAAKELEGYSFVAVHAASTSEYQLVFERPRQPN